MRIWRRRSCQQSLGGLTYAGINKQPNGLSNASQGSFGGRPAGSNSYEESKNTETSAQRTPTPCKRVMVSLRTRGPNNTTTMG